MQHYVFFCPLENSTTKTQVFLTENATRKRQMRTLHPYSVCLHIYIAPVVCVICHLNSYCVPDGRELDITAC